MSDRNIEVLEGVLGYANLMQEERNAIRAAIALMRGQSEDRKALEYLMGQFDAEFHVCARCGHEDSTRDCDSAIYLRRHLAAMQQTEKK